MMAEERMSIENRKKRAIQVALRLLRANWILIWLLVMTLLLVSVFSYGAYTGVTTAKRVVSLSSHDGNFFTSKYMSRNNIGVQQCLFTYDDTKTEEENKPVIVIDVCNYDMALNVYDKDFHFRLRAKLVTPNGEDIASIPGTPPTAYRISFKSVTDTTGAMTESYPASTTVLSNTYQDIGGDYLMPASDKTRYLFEVEFDVNDIKTTPEYAIKIES